MERKLYVLYINYTIDFLNKYNSNIFIPLNCSAHCSPRRKVFFGCCVVVVVVVVVFVVVVVVVLLFYYFVVVPCAPGPWWCV